MGGRGRGGREDGMRSGGRGEEEQKRRMERKNRM